MGDVEKPLFFEDGKLKLTYENGDICTVKGSTVPHIRTTITFICDFEAVVSLQLCAIIFTLVVMIHVSFVFIRIPCQNILKEAKNVIIK